MDKELILAVRAALKAGIETLQYYRKDIPIEIKEDNSPLTQADKSSNDIIIDHLSISELPILSEESEQTAYNIRKNWDRYWLIDPLDGTKEFIRKSDEYTVNIALMQNNYPVSGVVYAPAKDLLFYGSKESGAYKVVKASYKNQEDIFNSKHRIKLPYKDNSEFPVIVASKSHLNDRTSACISQIETYFGNIKMGNYGSSLKLCMIAEGVADIYPRLGPTMEWDTAASHAIVEASGNYMLQYPDLIRMEYNKQSLYNSDFIVFNSCMLDALKEIFRS